MVKERMVKEKEKERMGKETGRMIQEKEKERMGKEMERTARETGRTARGRGRVTARDEDRNHRM
jgi:hypothetical protein